MVTLLRLPECLQICQSQERLSAPRLQEAYVLKCAPTLPIYKDTKALHVNGLIFCQSKSWPNIVFQYK